MMGQGVEAGVDGGGGDAHQMRVNRDQVAFKLVDDVGHSYNHLCNHPYMGQGSGISISPQ